MFSVFISPIFCPAQIGRTFRSHSPPDLIESTEPPIGQSSFRPDHSRSAAGVPILPFMNVTPEPIGKPFWSDVECDRFGFWVRSVCLSDLILEIKESYLGLLLGILWGTLYLRYKYKRYLAINLASYSSLMSRGICWSNVSRKNADKI